MVTEFHRTQSPAAVLRGFRQQFPGARCPTRGAIYENVRKYQSTGTSHSLNKGHSGRPRTMRTPQNIQAVEDAL